MSKSKPAVSTTVKTKPGHMFLTDSLSKSQTKMVSVRIDEDLLDRFKAASEIAEQHGKGLTMTRVVQQALEMAIQEVSSLEPIQNTLPLENSLA